MGVEIVFPWSRYSCHCMAGIPVFMCPHLPLPLYMPHACTHPRADLHAGLRAYLGQLLLPVYQAACCRLMSL